MAFTPSIAILFLLVAVSSIVAGSKQSSDVVVHEGQCPPDNFPNIPIRCRRRVCLPEELIPRCNDDGDCASTHKCCRPMCSCTVQCVTAVLESDS